MIPNEKEGFIFAQDKRREERLKGLEPPQGDERFSPTAILTRAQNLTDRSSAFTYTEFIIEMNRILRGK